MVHIAGLDHLVLRTARPDAMIRFYCDVLGCTVERRVEEIGLVQLRAGRALIDLVDVAREGGGGSSPRPGQAGRNLDHFCLRVDPFEEADVRAHLATHGVDAGDTVRRYGAEGFGPSIYISDPDGNTVELKGPPSPA